MGHAEPVHSRLAARYAAQTVGGMAGATRQPHVCEPLSALPTVGADSRGAVRDPQAQRGDGATCARRESAGDRRIAFDGARSCDRGHINDHADECRVSFTLVCRAPAPAPHSVHPTRAAGHTLIP
eukprot:2419932-Prymnesium_polylepis.1